MTVPRCRATVIRIELWLVVKRFDVRITTGQKHNQKLLCLCRMRQSIRRVYPCTVRLSGNIQWFWKTDRRKPGARHSGSYGTSGA